VFPEGTAAAGRRSHHELSKPPTVMSKMISEWQNMVLGGRHGRHKPNCSLCRKLDFKLLHFA
jgi:hypothetical protein